MHRIVYSLVAALVFVGLWVSPSFAQEDLASALLELPFPDDSWELVEEGPVSAEDLDGPDGLLGWSRTWVSEAGWISVAYAEGFDSLEGRGDFLESSQEGALEDGFEEVQSVAYDGLRAYDDGEVLVAVLPHGNGVLLVVAFGEERARYTERTVIRHKAIEPSLTLETQEVPSSFSIGYWAGVAAAILLAVLLLRGIGRRIRQPVPQPVVVEGTEVASEEIGASEYAEGPLPPPFGDE